MRREFSGSGVAAVNKSDTALVFQVRKKSPLERGGTLTGDQAAGKVRQAHRSLFPAYQNSTVIHFVNIDCKLWIPLPEAI